MSKKRVSTEDERVQVEALAAYLNQDQIADYLGVSRVTFAAMRDREPELEAAYKRGKAKAIGMVAQSLLQKAQSGDTACQIFYLKAQAGWSERQTHEISGPDGKAIAIERKPINFADLDDDQLLAAANAILIAQNSKPPEPVEE